VGIGGASLTQSIENKRPKSATVKHALEVFLMPLVIAAVGSAATFFITKQQNENSERVAAAQLASAERVARSERELKALELFSRMIASRDERERTLAVRLLGSIDPELAARLAGAVAEDQSETPAVRSQAREALKGTGTTFGFPVVGSFRSLDDAMELARSIRGRLPGYTSEVYLSENSYYAVTLGGYLSLEEARMRAEFARQKGIARDAYVRWSTNWGENLLR
jgi:cell division septation protein DedD